MNIQQIGTLHMQYDHQEDGVLYYSVSVKINGRATTFMLPRHHPMLGWIEAFGLPPQSDWVVLDAFEPFQKDATLMLDNTQIHETVSFSTDPAHSMHSIVTNRQNGEQWELFEWFENYRDAPDVIHNVGVFTHSGGVYQYTLEKNLTAQPISDTAEYHQTCNTFLNEIAKQFGAPEQIWLKHCQGGGTPPPLYHRLFPELLSSDELARISACICEAGYTGGGDTDIERAHGDWHKLFIAHDKLFYIREDGFTIRTVTFSGRETPIKDTYTKTLYTYTP